MNNNMINPANYYNPFAKYNSIVKNSRGVYIPKDTEPLLKSAAAPKSSNIFSDNYDAEADVLENMDNLPDSPIMGFINKLFNNKENN